MISILWKYIDEIFKYFPEPLGQFQPNLAQSILEWSGFKNVKDEEPFNSHKVDTRVFHVSKNCYDNHMCLLIWTVSEVSDMFQGPLV